MNGLLQRVVDGKSRSLKKVLHENEDRPATRLNLPLDPHLTLRESEVIEAAPNDFELILEPTCTLNCIEHATREPPTFADPLQQQRRQPSASEKSVVEAYISLLRSFNGHRNEPTGITEHSRFLLCRANLRIERRDVPSSSRLAINPPFVLPLQGRPYCPRWGTTESPLLPLWDDEPDKRYNG